MNREQSKKLLAVYRPNGEDRLDPDFANALQETRHDAELADWFAEEREFDRAIAAHLAPLPVPFGLKTRILATAALAPPRKWRWLPALGLTAAGLFVLAQVVSLQRGMAQHSGSLAEYEQEMLSFVQLQPPLEMESPKIGPIRQWLAQHKAPLADIPPTIAAVETMGCRVFSFRGHQVTLICFCHGQTVAHLFMVDRAALTGFKPLSPPRIAEEGVWTAASWTNENFAYLLAVHGDRRAVQEYLPHA
jgi:hypothetical protein